MTKEISRPLQPHAHHKPPTRGDDHVEFNLRSVFDKYVNQGSRYEFDVFMATLVKRQSGAAFLAGVLGQLRELVNVLEPKTFESSLVNALFADIRWHEHHSRQPALLRQLADLLIDLSSAYTCYIYKCMSMMVRMFAVTETVPGVAETTTTTTTTPHREPVDCEALFRLAHEVLGHLIKVAPSAKGHLVELVDKSFPYMTKDTAVQENYTRNVLALAATYKDLRLPLMELCVQRMLKMDVKMTREQIEEAESEPDKADEEETDEQATPEGAVAKMNVEDATATAAAGPMKHPLADRLDAMMRQFLAFIERSCAPSGRTATGARLDIDWDATKAVYKDLLFIFDSYVLCTYGSSHVQFLMFYTCSLRAPLAEGFIDYLWKQFSATHSCAVRRQICAYYLGSYLARAKYVSASLCVAMLELVVAWIHAYIANSQSSTSNNTGSSSSSSGAISAPSNTDLDLHAHRTFYALCQTLFYVIVYRHQQLFLDDQSAQLLDRVRGWRLNDIVGSKFNPLRFVVPTVRDKFARVGLAHQVAFCYPIMDANSRVSLPVSGQAAVNFNSFYSMTQWGLKSTTSGGDKPAVLSQQLASENPLDSFFPFDPYLLRRSKPFIAPVYQEFDELLYLTVYDDDDEDEDDDEDDSEEDEDNEDDDDDDAQTIDDDDISDQFD